MPGKSYEAPSARCAQLSLEDNLTRSNTERIDDDTFEFDWD